MSPFLQLPETKAKSNKQPQAKRAKSHNAWFGSIVLWIISSCLLSLPAQALTSVVPEAQAQSDDTPSTNIEQNEDKAAVDGNEEAESEAEATEAASEASEPVNVPAAGNLTDKDTVIATKPDQVNDQDIKQRISGIYSEIEGLKALNVSVNQGVVSLSGEVPNEKKAQQAISLANRVSDVVAVEDRISRTLDVQDNVTPVISALKQQFRGFIHALPLLLVAIVVFIIVVWFGSWLARRESLWQRITPNPFIAELLAQTVKILFIVIGLLLGLSLMGAEAIIGTLLGGAGVIGIAVGFAVKDTIENYIASLMLSIRQPFRARDYVDINGQEGVIVRLTSRATILMTADGNQLRIPNSEVFKATILNYTKNPERRFTFQLAMDANDDPLAAIKVGIQAVRDLEFVLEDPEAVCIVTEVSDSNILLEFQVWVDQTNTDITKARSIAIREAKHALENNGFILPEPTYRMHFDNEVEEALINYLAAWEQQKSQDTTSHNPELLNKLAEEALASSKSRKADNLEKEKAKERAKAILGNTQVDEVLDARPDPKLMQKVEEEIQDNSGDQDLLDCNSPQE
ncbi:mechanosensitive ion channel domain-containing protein [Psychrobacter phenylpyruvicus]|uniref:Small-conductance mechanosensitive channel n=1 Tax=Psychrobacter phenylpyruvicus TaxID=29432 RepID=A0A379LQ96_9GAMM|nr:mechanosensitive ion channel domain-containing protein [Psychrobacter phenylpyruvicus]SUD91982.1 Small-conductance mechanosensitive channel [Psychrobacter phenylpyruvicus]